MQDESLVVTDEDGRPLFTQGYLLDITARKQSEHEGGNEQPDHDAATLRR